MYELRNDPLVRASSFHTEEIPYEQHQKWYEQKRKNENCRIYILEDAGAPVGQVRADRDERGEAQKYPMPLQSGRGEMAMRRGCSQPQRSSFRKKDFAENCLRK